MKCLTSVLLVLIAPATVTWAGSSDSAKSPADGERLGTVSFPTSCSEPVRAPFNRGVALLHDFWYGEAEHQFEQIAAADPTCAMAHWGEAMSQFHQIWNRPNERAMQRGWAEIQKAQALGNKTEREREYISALAAFYEAGKRDYQARVDAYSAGMASLYRHYPSDVDAGAFYALSLLASRAPDDTSLSHEQKALTVLTPLFATNPEHPGLAHYVIHACDNPTLATQGLDAARRYGEIAPSAPHAAHMPSHIFARLGMWQDDIQANLASVAASEQAATRHQAGGLDQFHADDFLLYAYLQSAQDVHARGVLEKTTTLLDHFELMPDMGMPDMMPYYYRSKFIVFYDLEMEDWKSAAALEPLRGAPPEVQMLTYWARIVGDGHLREPQAAHADLAKYEDLLQQLRNSKQAYVANSTGTRIERGEALAWTAFAEGLEDKAVGEMRESADLQDKVGQAEVDIPAREMLADMLLELHKPEQALTEFDLALKMSPHRFNGLFHAGLAAEAIGDKARAGKYYSALLAATENGTQSSRKEFAHVKDFFSENQVARK